MYVTDTHGFLWFLTEDKRLGKKAEEIFVSCDKGETIIVIPSIVLMEALLICERKKVDMEFKKVLKKIQNTFNYPVYPLDLKVVNICEELKQFADPHDRIVVATAKLLDVSIITKDKRIRDSKLVETIW
ncbi:MAG: PIN domain-containing protein [Candidatus Aenigmarchaeota archaeon]|nr:PIN domain-containing protein [Candidatus Aenigmarchaeota archaeon]